MPVTAHYDVGGTVLESLNKVQSIFIQGLIIEDDYVEISHCQ